MQDDTRPATAPAASASAAVASSPAPSEPAPPKSDLPDWSQIDPRTSVPRRRGLWGRGARMGASPGTPTASGASELRGYCTHVCPRLQHKCLRLCLRPVMLQGPRLPLLSEEQVQLFWHAEGICLQPLLFCLCSLCRKRRGLHSAAFFASA